MDYRHIDHSMIGLTTVFHFSDVLRMKDVMISVFVFHCLSSIVIGGASDTIKSKMRTLTPILRLYHYKYIR